MNKKLYDILLEMNKAKTWEGVSKHNARRFIESYVDRIEKLLNNTPDNKRAELDNKNVTPDATLKLGDTVRVIESGVVAKINRIQDETWYGTDWDYNIFFRADELELFTPDAKEELKYVVAVDPAIEGKDYTGYYKPKQKPSECIRDNYEKRAKGFTYTDLEHLDSIANNL